MDIEEVVKNVGPLVGLAILGLLVWKMFKVDGGGKKITGMIQSRKLIIADLFLVGLSFLEGLVAANMGDDSLGDSYTTRFASHFVLSMVGAYAGFICVQEVIDFVSKIKEKKYSKLYLFIQFLQPILYFIIAGMMPMFNLIIISKGAGSYDTLAFIWGGPYSVTQIYGALDDVTARSLLMVIVHILLTLAVAIGSIDDVEAPEEEEEKELIDDDDKQDSDYKEPSWQQSISYMATILGVPRVTINNTLGLVEKKVRIELKGRLTKTGWFHEKNIRDQDKAATTTDKAKAINDGRQTKKNFETLWEDIEDADTE